MVESILALSDIHSNLEALEAVLVDSRKYGPFEQKINLGDLVGYGPDPIGVIKVAKNEGFISILGNHDRAVLNESAEDFKPYAKDAVMLNRILLQESPDAMDYLKGLSNRPITDPRGRFKMVHGSFAGTAERNKDIGAFEDIYVRTSRDIFEAMQCLIDVPIGIVGHTHTPLFANYWIDTSYYPSKSQSFMEGFKGVLLEIPEDGAIKVEPGNRPDSEVPQNLNSWENKTLINPGSVGQPRDGDYKAAYAILRFDGSKLLRVEYKRVRYDISKTQNKMEKLGFSPGLINRLTHGV